ncbi:E3 ubiquitin-protein ligase MARCHF4-like [Lampris incognitus]|uniref:E3 ubiquitin-protein ligase MARCHF4-like n=1 Tax=Lampris incognitus TaxID=2546036 RepID=UPI0024B5188B|nr:E3 ubiquitin-protein ligase MARCHF4-like [Lampris incognitus]
MGLLARWLVLEGGWGKAKHRYCCFASSGALRVSCPLRPHAQPDPGPMSGPHITGHAARGNPGDTEPPTHEPAPLPEQAAARQTQAGGSVLSLQPKRGQPGSLDNSSSSSSSYSCFSSKEKLEERMSVHSCSDSGFRTPLCRICFQGPEQGELLSPCRCSGSVRCTHEPCLIKWISERGSWSCELCYYKYHVIGISTKNPLQWQAISLTVIEKVQIAAAVLGSLFLVASISWLVWSSVSPHARWQRQDLLFQICYAMYGFMDLVCIVLIVHEGPSVFRIFHRWQAVNQRWKVLNYDKARDVEEQEQPESTHWGPEPNPRMAPLSAGTPGAGPPSPPSSSSLVVAVAAAEASLHRVPTVVQTSVQRSEEEDSGMSPISTTATATTTTSQSDSSNNTEHSSSVTEQNRSYRWTYSLLHLLGHRRPFMEQQDSENPRRGLGLAPPQPRDTNRELVMRVTTV